jgi:hypothetical protein
MKTTALVAGLALASALATTSARAELVPAEPAAPAAEAVPAAAEPAAEPAPAPPMSRKDAECAASFPERLADAKAAVREHIRQEGLAKRDTATQAKFDWFDAHCRFLSPLEIAIRKLDDPNSFVCDTSKGRPKGLTTQFVLAGRGEAESAAGLQKLRGDSALCSDSDKAARINVYLGGFDDWPATDKLEILCYGDERPKFVKACEDVAAARAKGYR